MSSHANTNYGPPPMGQINMVNGMPPISQAQMTQQHQMSQQQQPTQMSQKQTQQFPGMPLPPPSLNTNMSKFMPPSTPSNVLPGNNAPPLSANGAPYDGQRPPMSQPPLATNLPPHMRPPGMVNGPSVGMTNTTSNGAGNATASANSSRTASPSIQLGQQQHQQQYKPIVPTNQGSTPITSTTAAPPMSTVNNLTGSMQNLNINRVNGPTMSSTLPPQSLQMHTKVTAPPTSQQQAVASSFQVSPIVHLFLIIFELYILYPAPLCGNRVL